MKDRETDIRRFSMMSSRQFFIACYTELRVMYHKQQIAFDSKLSRGSLVVKLYGININVRALLTPRAGAPTIAFALTVKDRILRHILEAWT